MFLVNHMFGGINATLRSQSGNAEACIIDCQGSASDSHYGFYFEDEGPAAVLENITITNGYRVGEGGGITILYASPTIRGCRLVDNYAGYWGGRALHHGHQPAHDRRLPVHRQRHGLRPGWRALQRLQQLSHHHRLHLL